MTAAYMRDRCFNNRLKQTAYFAITGKKKKNKFVKHESLRIRVLLIYSYKQDKQKVDPRYTKMIFLGYYEKGSVAYLVYIPETGKVMKYRVVKFPTTWKGVDKQTQTETSLPDDDDDDDLNTVYLMSTDPKRFRINLLNNPMLRLNSVLLASLPMKV